MTPKLISTENHDLIFEEDVLKVITHGKPPILIEEKEIEAWKRTQKRRHYLFLLLQLIGLALFCSSYYLSNEKMISSSQNFLLVINTIYGCMHLLSFPPKRQILTTIPYKSIEYIKVVGTFFNGHSAFIVFRKKVKKQEEIEIEFSQTTMQATTDWSQFQEQITKLSLLPLVQPLSQQNLMKA